MASLSTRTFSKKTGEVIEERRPILSSSLPKESHRWGFLTDEAGDAARACGVGVGLGGDDHHARDAARGHVELGAVDHPVVAVLLHGEGLGAARVGARVRLGEAERADHLALGQGDQVFALLLRGAEQVERRGAERGVGGQGQAERAVAAGDLFDGDGIGEGVAACAAVFFGEGHAHAGRARPSFR